MVVANVLQVKSSPFLVVLGSRGMCARVAGHY